MFTYAQTTVDCSVGSVNTTYCYVNDDTTSFDFVSSDGSPLIVIFNAGEVENTYDQLVVTDSDGTELYNGYGTGGDLSGLTFQSSGDSITVAINSDFVINCSDNGYTAWDFDVACITCTLPTATYTTVNDCAASGGFLIDVNVTDIGSASSLTISDNQSSPTQALTASGIVQFGPYSNGTNVIITVENNDDVNCIINSSGLTQPNCPPPAPVGVTCSSGSSSFIFTEEFDTVNGWTGDLNNGNGSWEIPNGSTSVGTGPSSAFSGGEFMNYEASGSPSTTASAVSPAIDLGSALDGAELSFYMHAFGLDMGTLNVGVGTAPSGPFTTLETFSGQYQTTETDPWIPVGINLNAYLGQVIYIEFSHTGTGIGYQGDMSIDYVRVETCGTFCIAPSSLEASSISDVSATISWVANSSESAWEYVVQPAGTGLPSGSGTTVNATTVNLTGLSIGTTYEVYVRANCGSEMSNWGGPLTFTTTAPPPPATFTTSSISTTGTNRAVVDMNGDFLDDIVSTDATNVNIQYQTGSGFTETNITTTAADYLPSWSLAAADYDRNGYNDLLYGGGSGVTFMRANNTGTGFTEISGTEYVFSQRSNFVDINNDGHLDAFVCHDVNPNVYYMNDGSGNLSFNQGGLGDDAAGGNYGSIWIDYDNDRDMDMFIAKCRGGSTTININEMHENNGDGTFSEVGSSTGLADPLQTWSAAWGDFDNDGDMDVFVGASSTSDGTHKLMRNNGDKTFTDVTSSSGILPDLTNTGIENVTYDFDNDGNLDIASNGSVLFGNGDLTFTVYDGILSGSNGSFGDLNNDGFIDAFSGGTLYTNDTNSNNWIVINTIGVASNINGIGARIELATAAGTQIRDVRSGEGFRYMSTLNTHFGIGAESAITSIVIYWPSGTIDVIENPTINTTLSVTEGSFLGIEDEALAELTIYPNPVKDQLFINTPIVITDKIATVFNVNGQRVLNRKLSSNSLNVSELSAGIYFLRLESEGKVTTRKFIKEK